MPVSFKETIPIKTRTAYFLCHTLRSTKIRRLLSTDLRVNVLQVINNLIIVLQIRKILCFYARFQARL